MGNSIYLIVNVLVCIFSDSSKNTLSDAAKFVRGLRWHENGLLNEVVFNCTTRWTSFNICSEADGIFTIGLVNKRHV